MASAIGKVKEFFGFVEEDDFMEVKPVSEAAPVVRAFKGAVSHQQPSKAMALSEIKVEEPRIYEDSLHIATHLRDNKPVVINLKYLDSASGKRLIDFVCGTAYAINGHMMKIGENIFLFTPEHVLIADQSEKGHFEQTSTPASSEFEERDSFFKRAAIG